MVLCDGWAAASTTAALAARRYWGSKGFYTNFVVLDDSGETPDGHDDRVFTFPPAKLGEDGRAMLFSTATLVVKGELPDVTSNHAPGAPPEIARVTTSRGSIHS